MAQIGNKYKRIIRSGVISKKDVGGTDEMSFLYKILSSDAILLPIAIGLIYGLTIIREITFLSTFQLPLKFASIEYIDLVNTLMTLIFIYGWAIFTSSLIVVFLRLDDNQKKIPFSFYTTLTTYVTIRFSYSFFFNEFVSNLISIPSTILLVFITSNGFKAKTKESEFDDLALIKTFDAHFELDTQKRTKYPFQHSIHLAYLKLIGLARWLVLIIGPRFFYLLFNIWLLIFLFGKTGIDNANAMRNFYVANTSPECAVLYQSASIFLCVPFDRTKNEIEPSFKVIPVNDTKNITFTKEIIGPLHLKHQPTSTPLPTFTPTITNTPLPTNTPVPTLTATS